MQSYSLQSPILSDETEDELQLNPESCVEICFNEFISKGGTFIRLDGDAQPFILQPGDIVFSSCSGGNNRSQTLWGLLRQFSDKIDLKPPHATQYGFDPYNGKANWLRIKTPQRYDEFELWAGAPKSKKLGWDVFAAWLDKKQATQEELSIMKLFYDREYYSPDVSTSKRRVYITFMANAHVHLYRLVQTNTSLKNVVVVLFPLEDLIKHPLSEWNTFPGSVKTYREFSRKLATYLDFSQLN